MKLLLTLGPDPITVMGFVVAILVIACLTFIAMQHKKSKLLKEQVNTLKEENNQLKLEMEKLKVNIIS